MYKITAVIICLITFWSCSNRTEHIEELNYYSVINSNMGNLLGEPDSILSQMIDFEDSALINGLPEENTMMSNMLSDELVNTTKDLSRKIDSIKVLADINDDLNLKIKAIILLQDMKTMHEHSFLRILRQLKPNPDLTDTSEVHAMHQLLPKLLTEQHSFENDLRLFREKHNITDEEVSKLMK